jgi:hypothetical protein
MRQKSFCGILVAVIIVLVSFQVAGAALVNFKSGTVAFRLLDASTFEATLPKLSFEYLDAETANGEIRVKQEKVKGDVSGEKVFAGLDGDYQVIGTMDPRHNGWQKFNFDPTSFFDKLYQGLLLRVEDGGGELATPTRASFRLFGINQVPVPSAAWLLGAGLIALVGIRRKFKH